MRPTGRMHIGNYFGALANWVRLQNETVTPIQVGAQQAAPLQAPQRAYECFYFIADWHSLTSDYADTSGIAQNVIEIATDYLAGGLDPEKSTIFLQSLVPEHAELHLLLSMITPLGWLERVPTYKEALENVKDKDLHNYGFLGYPVLQCADIVIYSSRDISGLFVPTGEDQVSHVETSREIVRRFELFYGIEIRDELFSDPNNRTLLGQLVPSAFSPGAFDPGAFQSSGIRLPARGQLLTPGAIAEAKTAIKAKILEEGFENFCKRLAKYSFESRFIIRKTVLVEPQSMVTSTPRIPGLDGRKMSKSYGNTIMLSESDANIRAKTKVMKTDPQRQRRTDKGNPEVCPVYDWHKLFAPRNEAGEYTAQGKGTLEWAAHGCRTAGIGCIECKAAMAENLIKWIAPVRERRVEYEKHPGRVLEVLDEGSRKARIVAQGTMERVREAVFGWDKKIGDVKAEATQVHGTHT